MPTLALCTICLRPVKSPHSLFLQPPAERPDESATATISIKMTSGGMHGGDMDLISITRDYACAECDEWWKGLGALVRQAIEERRKRFEEITRELTAISIVDAGTFIPLLGALTGEEEEVIRRIAARQNSIAVMHALSGDASVIAKRLGAEAVAKLQGPAPKTLGGGSEE